MNVRMGTGGCHQSEQWQTTRGEGQKWVKLDQRTYLNDPIYIQETSDFFIVFVYMGLVGLLCTACIVMYCLNSSESFITVGFENKIVWGNDIFQTTNEELRPLFGIYFGGQHFY